MSGANKDIYQKEYYDGLVHGFSIDNIWQVTTAHSRPSEVTCFTPFEYDGMRLTGFCVVETSDDRKNDGLHAYNTCELYYGSKNMEDVIFCKTGGGDYDVLDTRTNQMIGRDEALAEMGKFCAAASEFPHVMVGGEYFEQQRIEAGIRGEKYDKDTSLRDANGYPQGDYYKYLCECEKQKAAGVVFVGERSKPGACVNEYDGPSFAADEKENYYYSKDEYRSNHRENEINEYIARERKKAEVEKRNRSISLTGLGYSSIESTYGTQPGDT